MRQFLTILGVSVCLATGAMAQSGQVVTNAAAVSDSGVAGYPHEVVGADGITYLCRPPVTSASGVQQYNCRQANVGAGNALGGLAAGPVMPILVVLGVVAAASSGSN